MDSCSSLTELPVDLGSSTSLQELVLKSCSELKRLPDSVEKLSSLTSLNLSQCGSLLNLPHGFGKLTCLLELNLKNCNSLESIPLSVGELKLLRALNLECCGTLKELPDGFCNLVFITNLSFKRCASLEKLPDGFGKLESFKVLDMTGCERLHKLPEGFGQLKNLEVLVLEDCSELRKLCNDFHCLSSLQRLHLSSCKRLEKLPDDFHFLTSLQQLYLNGCERLEKLPEDFHYLNSLQFLALGECPKLEGKSMDHMAKMNTLQVVSIMKSEELVKRWAEIPSNGHGSSSLLVISKEDPSISESNKENIKNSILSELDDLLGESHSICLIFHQTPPPFSYMVSIQLRTNSRGWPLVEETVNDVMQIKRIYIDPHFDRLPTEVKDTIFVVHLSESRTVDILTNVWVTREGDDVVDDENDRCYLLMDTKMVRDGNSDNYRPCSCWRFLKASELEEFVVVNSTKYRWLKQLVETDQENNEDLLTELFAPQGDETTPVFQKNESSQQVQMPQTYKGRVIFYF